MSKDRLTPCVNYVNEGNCAKGHEGTFKKSCQHCRDYRARASVEHVNRKKEKLQKIREKEME